MSPSPLSGPSATDRSTAPKFLHAGVDHIRGTYCSANEAAQVDEFDNFSAVADLLFNIKEDFLRSFRHVVIQTRLSGAPQHFGICLLEAALTPKRNAEDAKLRTGFSPWTFCRRWPRPSGRRSHAEVLVQTR